MPSATPRAVVDTNLLVRALLSAPLPRTLIESWLDGLFTLVVSSETVGELESVISRPKFRASITAERAATLLAAIREHANQVDPTQLLQLCRDPKDDVFLSVAASAQASHLVTADNDLLEDESLRTIMRQQFGVHVLPVHEFLALLSDTKPDDASE